MSNEQPPQYPQNPGPPPEPERQDVYPQQPGEDPPWELAPMPDGSTMWRRPTRETRNGQPIYDYRRDNPYQSQPAAPIQRDFGPTGSAEAGWGQPVPPGSYPASPYKGSIPAPEEGEQRIGQVFRDEARKAAVHYDPTTGQPVPLPGETTPVQFVPPTYDPRAKGFGPTGATPPEVVHNQPQNEPTGQQVTGGAETADNPFGAPAHTMWFKGFQHRATPSSATPAGESRRTDPKKPSKKLPPADVQPPGAAAANEQAQRFAPIDEDEEGDSGAPMPPQGPQTSGQQGGAKNPWGISLPDKRNRDYE